MFKLFRWSVGCLIASGVGLVQAQPASDVWQLSAAWQDYSEAQMSLKGPELGVHWQSRRWEAYNLEADAHWGLQNYSSSQSGRLEQVHNLDTRWRALRSPSVHSQWQYGLALHIHVNLLRGTTSLGFGGYDRLSTQVWLPVRWQSPDPQPWTMDAGWLLWGEHVSRLSQVNTSLQDVTNTQRRGLYFQVSQKISSSRGDFEPYARWTWVDDSDIRQVTVNEQIKGAYEPLNRRLNVGVKWQFR